MYRHQQQQSHQGSKPSLRTSASRSCKHIMWEDSQHCMLCCLPPTGGCRCIAGTSPVGKVLPHIAALQPLGNGACSCEACRSALDAVQQVAAAAADPLSAAGAVHVQGCVNAAEQGPRDKTDWSISARRAQPDPAAARQAKGAPAATGRAGPEPHPGTAAQSRISRATRSKWD